MFYGILAIQVFALFYHQLTTRCDLFPFNGVRYYSVEERRKEALVNGIMMVIPIILSATKIPVLIGVSAVIWSFIGLGAILNWWFPYVTGIAVYKMPNNETWSNVHERIFSKTTHILPYIKNNPRPNLEHVILHVFIVGSAVLLWLYLLKS